MTKKQAIFLISERKIIRSLIFGSFLIVSAIYHDNQAVLATEVTLPKVSDSTLKVELVSKGLDSPTSMAFLDNNSLLVLERVDQFGLLQMRHYKIYQ